MFRIENQIISSNEINIVRKSDLEIGKLLMQYIRLNPKPLSPDDQDVLS